MGKITYPMVLMVTCFCEEQSPSLSNLQCYTEYARPSMMQCHHSKQYSTSIAVDIDLR